MGIYGYEEGFSYFVYFECRVFQKAHPGATCGGRGNVCWVKGALDEPLTSNYLPIEFLIFCSQTAYI